VRNERNKERERQRKERTETKQIGKVEMKEEKLNKGKKIKDV
jgi:hypothetical protein